MNFEAKARQIDADLTKLGVTKVKKQDLRAKYNIAHDNASAIWVCMVKLGWSLSWYYLERPS